MLGLILGDTSFYLNLSGLCLHYSCWEKERHLIPWYWFLYTSSRHTGFVDFWVHRLSLCKFVGASQKSNFSLYLQEKNIYLILHDAQYLVLDPVIVGVQINHRSVRPLIFRYLIDHITLFFIFCKRVGQYEDKKVTAESLISKKMRKIILGGLNKFYWRCYGNLLLYCLIFGISATPLREKTCFHEKYQYVRNLL